MSGARFDLLPCPLCGGEAKQIEFNRVACKKCGLRQVSDQSFQRNRALWNTRQPSLGQGIATLLTDHEASQKKETR